MSSRGLMRKMARVQPQGIANRNVWAKEESPLTRVEKKLPEHLQEKQLRTVTTEARRERISVGGWWARCFSPKIIISIPSLGSSITHRSSHISQRAGMNPLILQSLTMSAPTSLPCHHLAVLCLVAQSCPTLCNPMKCMPGSSIHGDSSGKNTGVSCHALLQGIFPTQGSNPGLPHCRRILYHLGHQWSPIITLFQAISHPVHGNVL